MIPGRLTLKEGGSLRGAASNVLVQLMRLDCSRTHPYDFDTSRPHQLASTVIVADAIYSLAHGCRFRVTALNVQLAAGQYQHTYVVLGCGYY